MTTQPNTTVSINRREWADRFLAQQTQSIRVGFDYAPTPFDTWNECSRDDAGGLGVAMGWHLLLAGNPGAGKSALALNLAAHASQAGVAVGYLTLEMSPEQLTRRVWAIQTKTHIRKIERGKSFDLTVARRVADEVVNSGAETIRVNTVRVRSIRQVLGVMQEWRELGTTFFILDYLQLIGDPSARTSTDEVGRISSAIRDFAFGEKVITLGLTQFNRETSRNHHDKPTIQGLYGGMHLESDADQVLLLDHSRYERVTDSHGRQIGARTYLLLAKNRHGPVGDIPVWFDFKTLEMREALPHEADSWPTR